MSLNEIPVELLSEIFERSMERDYFTPSHLHEFLHSFRQNYSPVNLIHVCQHWRAVAFSTSSLWASLSGEQFKPSRTSVPAMENWLQFSRNAPLYLRLSSRRDSKGPLFDHNHTTKMLHLFANHLDRWRLLSIYAEPRLARDITTVLQHAGGNLPPLEVFEVKLDSKTAQSVVDELAACLYPMKTLRRLYWMNCDYAIPVGLPWHQLHTLSIEASFTCEESILLLSRCVSASRATFRGSGRNLGHTATAFHHPHTTLSNLTSLTLDKHCDPLYFLRYFILPSLISLEIQVLQRDFAHLGDFLGRSKCPIEILNIIDTTSSNDDIVDFFRLPYLKSIQNVKLVVRKGEERMLDILRSHEDAKNIFPRLMVWEDLDWPEGVGWMEDVPETLLYSYQDGQLVFPPSTVIHT